MKKLLLFHNTLYAKSLFNAIISGNNKKVLRVLHTQARRATISSREIPRIVLSQGKANGLRLA